MRFITSIAIISVISIGASYAQQGNSYSVFVANAKKQLTRDFKDPSSAQFRNTAVYKSSEGLALCGEVNAKNGFGAYVGFAPFYATTTSHRIRSEDDNGIFEILFKLVCDKKVAAIK